jgi:hypothetical protein
MKNKQDAAIGDKVLIDFTIIDRHLPRFLECEITGISRGYSMIDQVKVKYDYRVKKMFRPDAIVTQERWVDFCWVSMLDEKQ